MKDRFGLDATLVKGRDGVFEVTHDGDLIYSKKANGRFPDAGEVEEVLASRLA